MSTQKRVSLSRAPQNGTLDSITLLLSARLAFARQAARKLLSCLGLGSKALGQSQFQVSVNLWVRASQDDSCQSACKSTH